MPYNHSPSSRPRLLATMVAVALIAAFTFTVGAATGPSRVAAATLPLRTTYVANSSSNTITEYAPGATGNTAPVATIGGAHTGLSLPHALLADPSGRLYVGNAIAGTVTEYDAGASGDIAPVATIGGSATQLTNPIGLALDRDGRLYVADEQSNAIVEFAPGANGNVAPVAVISGADTGLRAPDGLAFDNAGRLYVANGSQLANTVTAYAPGATGDAKPVVTIAGASTLLARPSAIAFDGSNHLWATNFGSRTITEYAAGAAGNVAPIATVAGAATKLGSPTAIAFDSAGHLHVADGDAHLLDYAGNANGNTAPAGELTGAATALAGPTGVTVAPPLFVTTASLPRATVGAPYSAAVRATLGVPPYQFSIAFGSLPSGLTINATTGFISGTPTTAGVYTFAAIVRDAATPTADVVGRALTIVVGPPQLYVATGASTVAEFAPAASGNTPPIDHVNTGGQNNGAPITVDNAGNLWVADTSADTLARYAPGASGTAPGLFLDPIASGLNEPIAIATDGNGRAYVTNVLGKSVSIFTPVGLSAISASTITGPDTGLSAPDGIAIDASGRAHVGASFNTITTYAAGATGDAKPVATLSGANTGIEFAASIAFDANGRMYVLSTSQQGASVRVFAANATGNTAPIAVISGSNTQLGNAAALALDPTGRLYVANRGSLTAAGSVLEFAPGANGNVAPAAALAGANTGITAATGIAFTPTVFITSSALPDAQLGQPYSASLTGVLGVPPYSWTATGGTLPNGITLHTNGVLSGTATTSGTATFTVMLRDSASPANTATRTFTLTASARPLVYVGNVGNDTVTAYTPGVNGNVAPALTLSGAATGLSGPDGFAIDPTGALYVANGTAAPAGSVTVYAPFVSGDTAPIRTIAGPNTGIVGPKALALDNGGRLYVASPLAGHVTVYAPFANGNVAPVATVTGLGNPNAITLDATGRLWVGDGDVVKVFPAGITGTVTTPVATLGGSHTALSGVEGLVFDSTGRLHVSNVNAQTLTTYAAGATGDVSPTATTIGVVNPFGLDVDAFDNLYVARDVPGASTVDEYAAAGGKVASINGASTALNRPEAVAVTPPLSVQTDRLPVARVGHAYFAQLDAALGTTPYRWALVKGSLPAGLTLAPTGAITGTPSKPATAKLTFAVTDASSPALEADVQLTLRVRR